jgi:hypothetical protein
VGVDSCARREADGGAAIDTIGDSYIAKVVLNELSDRYTRRRLEQTPLEAATWSKEASAPYPPAMLLSFAGLHALGEAVGIGFYGSMLLPSRTTRTW